MDDDIVRILVSTDNHLGFAERDPIRCDDCFAAFEEVLATARKKQVDFILMAGDMFHENKPTRRTLHSTMELLRKYCLGDDPVFTAILNDQKEVFKSGFGKVNYEDPYQSVCLPIFSIHGNHDDPSREGGGGEALAALDLLAVSNLINYFGKADRVEDIEITPILIRKGGTSLAIYGLGAIRDERLNRMWNQKKVKFVRLTEEQGREDFFNIFVLHQNRDYGRGAKNCVHESMIPEWMDLVIWGNEHECQPQLTESLVGTYRILQPGSSIASSYSSTESSLCPKHMAFFEIKEKKFRMRAIPYRQVRQFLYRDLSLRDYPHLDPNHSKIEEQIKDVLTTKINEMILEGRAAIADQPAEELAGIKYKLRDPQKILVRLRVDHEGFPALNQQRFGTHFVGEVANPADVILFAKKRKEGNFRATEGKLSSRTHVGHHEDIKKILAEGAEDEINKIKIEDLVNETLANSNHTLALLAETEMAQALDDYIVKKQPNAIIDLVTESLNRTQKVLNADKSADDKAAILKATSKVKQKTEDDIAKESGKKVVRDTLRDLDAAASGNKAARDRLSAASDGEDDSVAPKRKTPGARASSARSQGAAQKKGTAVNAKTSASGNGKRGGKQQDSDGSDDDFDVGSEAEFQHATGLDGGDSDDLGGEGSDDSGAPKARGKGAAKGAKPTAKSRKAAASPAPTTKKAPAKKAATAKAPASNDRGTSKRAAATKTVKYAHDSDEEGSDAEAASDAEDGSGGDSDAVEDAHLLEDSSAGDSDAESPDDDVSEEDAPARGRGKAKAPAKRAPASSSSKAKSAPAAASKAKSTSSASAGSKSVASASSKAGRSAHSAVEVVDLDADEDEEYDDTRYSAGKSNATKAKAAPASRATAGSSGAASRGAVEVVNIDGEDDIVDDDGFMRSAAPASASLKSVATGTQQSSLRLPGGTVGRKRQLPLSFSQAPPSQLGGAKKAAASNKSLASGWDE